jgi:CBS domain-containing protein
MNLVRDIMTTTVRTLHRDTVIVDVEEAFHKHEIGGAPIVDDSGKAVGFITKSDISRFDATGEDPFYARAYEVANPKIIATHPSASIEQAAQLMLSEYVHHLLVMEGSTIVGVLSAFDFVKLVAGVGGDNSE